MITLSLCLKDNKLATGRYLQVSVLGPGQRDVPGRRERGHHQEEEEGREEISDHAEGRQTSAGVLLYAVLYNLFTYVVLTMLYRIRSGIEDLDPKYKL